jgi:3-oxoacyl-[acyl-carrier protein] reductase
MSRLMSQQALARWAEAADFINVVEFFLSPQSAMVTGQIIYLGGVG